eukprot:3339105-Amphidinium_carterae.1
MPLSQSGTSCTSLPRNDATRLEVLTAVHERQLRVELYCISVSSTCCVSLSDVVPFHGIQLRQKSLQLQFPKL